MPRTPFLGQAYQSRSTNLEDKRLINLYPEIVPSEKKAGSAKDVGAFYSTPGLDLLTAVGSGPTRGVKVVGNTLFTVSGNSVYAVNSSWQGTKQTGSLSSSSGPVSMIENGTQLSIFDGSNGYLVSGGGVSSLSLPFSNPSFGAYQDGFGLAIGAGSNQLWQSNSFDLSTWPGLSYGQANAHPDNAISVADLDRQVWIGKQYNTEIWYNAGNTNFAFSRIEGAFVEWGVAAQFSMAKAGDTLIWLAQNEGGQVRVVQTTGGYAVQRISHHGLEARWAKYGTVSDAIAYTYEQEGHLFYVLTFPAGNETWVYDCTTQLWHQRAAFYQGWFNRHQGNCHAFFNGKNVVGDYQTGNLYALDLNTYTDNGSQRKWLVTWRATQEIPETSTQFASLQIDMQTGIGVPDGTNPLVMLRWSDDGGHNWSTERAVSAGATGATAQRVRFLALGSTRANTGLDRLFELSSTDQFPAALIGASINI